MYEHDERHSEVSKKRAHDNNKKTEPTEVEQAIFVVAHGLGGICRRNKLSAPANTAYQEPLLNQTYRLALPRGGPQSGGAERREHLGGLNGTKCRAFPRRSLVCPAVRRGEEIWTLVVRQA